jgi:C1A family cysteine protease
MRLLCIFIGLFFIWVEANEEVLFSAWKIENNKFYDDDEEVIRFRNFKNSLTRIKERNEKSVSKVFGLTKFSDLSPEEFSQLLGYRHQNIESSSLQVPNPPVKDLPDTYDWRTYNKVTPVKDQGHCGSCWAQSTVENVESVWCIAKKIDCTTFTPLSVQQLVDCDNEDSGCGGGGPPIAYDYIKSAGGLETNAEYPYQAKDGTCNFQKSLVKVSITGWQYATLQHDETQMQNALINWGPLSICVDANGWQDYTGGILMASDCSTVLDHCVQIVGYNITAPIPYWEVRNSWGTDWGESGYIRLQFGQNTCGLTTVPTSSFVTP